MIGRDQIDVALPQSPPQAILVTPLADRRRAFQCRVAVGDLLGAERQIVRAGFDADLQSCRAGAPDCRQRVGRRQVHDVHASGRITGEIYQPIDRGLFGGGRPRS